MVNVVTFEKVYKLLVSLRSELRENYDNRQGETVETAYYRFSGGKRIVVRCEEDDEGSVRTTVSWDNNNADLRLLAREVVANLGE